MNELLLYAPWLIAMGVLTGFSAFFSGSEAALFLLRPADRRRMESGSAGEQRAVRLISDPDSLLSGVLFWNLLTNVTYFAVTSVVAVRIDREGGNQLLAAAFGTGSVLSLIFLGEMLPKSLAVVRPSTLARIVSTPLSVCVAAVKPIMPWFRAATVFSRRVIWPGFRPEREMELADVERAIRLSVADEQIIQQEHTVLRNIVHLSDIRVDEWMRPRALYTVYSPPVTLEDLGGEVPEEGYLLVSEPGSREIGKALRLDNAWDLSVRYLDRIARPVIYKPWKATVADAFEAMSHTESDVTAVVNEFGETIGILTLDDVLETIFAAEPSRSRRLLEMDPVRQIDERRWRVAGIISLRRLARRFGVEVPNTRSVTVAGAIQDTLGRVIEPGDECDCGAFHFRVVGEPETGIVLVEVTLRETAEEDGS